MGKSSKKASVEVAAAPVSTPLAKSGKKGKRDAKESLEKAVIAKKQKVEAVAVVPKLEKNDMKSKVSKEPPPKKKAESSSSEDSSDESEEEVKVPPKKDNKPTKALPKKADSSSSEDSSSESSDDEPASKKLPAVSKNGSAVDLSKKGKPESSSSSESDSSSDDEPAKPSKAPAGAKNGTPAVSKKQDKSNDSSESDESSDDSDDEEVAAKASVPAKKAATNGISKVSKVQESSDDSSESDSEDDVDTDVEMTDANSTDYKKKTDTKSGNNEPKTPATNQNASGGSKTLFVGNLSYEISQDDLAEFFKVAGEVVDVRLSTASDGSFKGYGHVEFSTSEEALKALDLNGNDLLGRPVRLDLARERGERGAYTPQSGNSYQKGGAGQKPTVFVRGFDKYLDEHQIRSSLEEHFGSCGEITRISIPKDHESGSSKGIAYVDFSVKDGLNNALELNGSELGGYALTIEEAKPRDGGQDGGRSGDRSGGWGGGGRSSGGRGGRFGGRGGRDGGRGGRDGGRGRGGRGGRGRGGNSFKPSMGTPGTGKKTTFGDY